MTPPLYRFRAVWPVTDMTVPRLDLLAEALADLRNVATRHGAHVLTTHPVPVLLPGRAVPGSGGAERVVVIDVEAVRLRDLPEGGVAREAALGLVMQGAA